VSVADHFPPGALIGLDTAPFIYHFESHPEFGGVMRTFFRECIDTGRNPAVTSVVTLAEVLVQPKSLGRADLVARYREYLTGAPGVRLHPLDVTSAEQAADLRASYGLRLPDAFQIAACLGAGATVFLGNDTKLRQVRELKVVLLSELTLESKPPADG
jgi:predicted nucleic acid-binding protein